MMVEALLSLKIRAGSSVHAIYKFIGANYSVPAKTFKKVTRNRLKKLTSEGNLLKVKASSKLSEAFKKTVSKRKAEPKITKSFSKPSKVFDYLYYSGTGGHASPGQ